MMMATGRIRFSFSVSFVCRRHLHRTANLGSRFRGNDDCMPVTNRATSQSAFNHAHPTFTPASGNKRIAASRKQSPTLLHSTVTPALWLAGMTAA